MSLDTPLPFLVPADDALGSGRIDPNFHVYNFAQWGLGAAARCSEAATSRSGGIPTRLATTSASRGGHPCGGGMGRREWRPSLPPRPSDPERSSIGRAIRGIRAPIGGAAPLSPL